MKETDVVKDQPVLFGEETILAVGPKGVTNFQMIAAIKEIVKSTQHVNEKLNAIFNAYLDIFLKSLRYTPDNCKLRLKVYLEEKIASESAEIAERIKEALKDKEQGGNFHIGIKVSSAQNYVTPLTKFEHDSRYQAVADIVNGKENWSEGLTQIETYAISKMCRDDKVEKIAQAIGYPLETVNELIEKFIK